MVFHEMDVGGGDFASIFASVAEAKQEEEERKQTMMFLRILDSMDERGNAKVSAPSTPGIHKEFMRVSITDDDLAEKTKRTDTDKRDDKVARVHTIKDLPPDDMFDFFGPPHNQESDVPDLTIKAGRRLGDGKIVYHASIGELFSGTFDGLGIFKVEIIFLLALTLFLIGIYIGRKMARRAIPKVLAPSPLLPVQQPQYPYQYHASAYQHNPYMYYAPLPPAPFNQTA